MSREVIVTSENAGFLQNVSIGPHRFQADESVEVGGCDAGPDPFELLLTALGACTAITIRMYANRKQWTIEAVRVRLMHEKIHAEDCLDCETKEGFVERIETEILLGGNLTDEQRQSSWNCKQMSRSSDFDIRNTYRDPTASGCTWAGDFGNSRIGVKLYEFGTGWRLTRLETMPTSAIPKYNQGLGEGVYSLPERPSENELSLEVNHAAPVSGGANPLPGG